MWPLSLPPHTQENDKSWAMRDDPFRLRGPWTLASIHPWVISGGLYNLGVLISKMGAVMATAS